MRNIVGNAPAVGLILLTLVFVWSSLSHDARLRLGTQLGERLTQESVRLQKNQQQTPTWENQGRKVDGETEYGVPAYSNVRLAETAKDSPAPPFAYAFYATNDEYACSVLVNIVRLHNLGVQYPIHVLVSSGLTQAYMTALEQMGAIIHIEVPPPLPLGAANGSYYIDCLLKLLAFKLHQLSPGLTRVLSFDSDQLIMKNLDHLFSGLPPVDLAAPRAYWLAKDFLASTFMMIELSDRLWSIVKDAMDSVGYGTFDMDLINDLLGDEVMMLSGEFATLNSHWEDWNLPKWYHPQASVNTTTIERLNALLRSGHMAQVIDQDSGPSRRQTTLVTDLGPPTRGDPGDVDTLKILSAPVPKPRYPDSHPIHQELYRLQEAAAVIHFSAVGKPWRISPNTLDTYKSDAHPLLAEQFRTWRDTAVAVCPER